MNAADKSVQSPPLSTPGVVSTPPVPASAVADEPVSSPPAAASQPQDESSAPAQPTTVGSGGKEQAPMPISSAADREGDEDDKPTVEDGEDVPVQAAAPAGEVPVSQELKEVGVEATADVQTPKIDPDVKNVGVFPAKDALPVAAAPSPKIVLPMTPEEAQETIKKNRFKIKDSVTWLATQVTYLWKKDAQKKGEI